MFLRLIRVQRYLLYNCSEGTILILYMAAKKDITPASSSQFISISDLFSQTLNTYKANWKLLALTQVPPFVVAALMILSSLMYGPEALAVIFGLASLVTTVASWLAIMWIISKENYSTDWKQAFTEGFPYFLPALVIFLITLVFVLGGLILLILPGIYLAVSYSFAHFTLFSEGRKGMEALRASKFYVKGYWWQVFLRMLLGGLALGVVQMILSFIGFGSDWESIREAMQRGAEGVNEVSILDIVGTAFASFVATPLSTIYPYLMYKSLKNVKGEYNG